MSKWSAAFRDSRWQKLRLKIMERDEWTCQCCGVNESATLNVHHQQYECGKAPWEYEDETLITLCEGCHKKLHDAKNELNKAICSCGAISGNILGIIRELIGYCHASSGPSFSFDTEYAVGYASRSINIDDACAIAICREKHIERRRTHE
jgi:hypothetical protein